MLGRAAQVEVGGLVVASGEVVCISLTVCSVCTIVPIQVEKKELRAASFRA